MYLNSTKRKAYRKRKNRKKKKLSRGQYKRKYVFNFPYWLLSKIFDVGFIYIVGTTAAKDYYKVGLSWLPEMRIDQIDGSIPGSTEFIEFSVRVWGMKKVEKKLHQDPDFAPYNFIWTGSGKTEWFKLSRSKREKLEGKLGLIKVRQDFKKLILFLTCLYLLYLYQTM